MHVRTQLRTSSTLMLHTFLSLQIPGRRDGYNYDLSYTPSMSFANFLLIKGYTALQFCPVGFESISAQHDAAASRFSTDHDRLGSVLPLYHEPRARRTDELVNFKTLQNYKNVIGHLRGRTPMNT